MSADGVNPPLTHCSVFFAYAVVTQESAIMFVDLNQVDEDVRSQLGNQIEVKPYAAFWGYLKEMASSLDLSKDSVGVIVFAFRSCHMTLTAGTTWK